MKSYSIGRDLKCDIVINDNTDVISRRHAILNVEPSGKMTIIDQSSNGTYVNGIRISSNVSVPVSRKDTISFAHVAKLDWNLVPNTNSYVKYAIASLVCIVIVLGAVFIFNSFNNNPSTQDKIPNVALKDSLNQKNRDEKKDTIKVKGQNVKKDSTKIIKKKQNKPKTQEKSKNQSGEDKKDTVEKEIKKPIRVIG